MAEEQRIVQFHGNVQGVGFRYTTARLAERYDVAGTVRNCPDGRVEVVVEGDGKEIDAFLSGIQGEMSRHIRDVQQQKAPPSGKHQSFRVVY